MQAATLFSLPLRNTDNKSRQIGRILVKYLNLILVLFEKTLHHQDTKAPRNNVVVRSYLNETIKSAVGEARAAQYRWSNRDTFIDFLVTQWPQHWLPKEYGTWKELLVACDGEARANLAKQLGSDEAKWDNTQHTIAVGQSGDPASPHYKDQINDWYNVTPRAFPFSKTAVEKATVKTTTLVP